MYLKNIHLIDFKNFEALEFNLHQRINCFTGNNGAGKTNLLDAVHYLCMCKSYFNPIDSQNIQHGKDFFVVQGIFCSEENSDNVYCAVKRNTKKQFKINKNDYERLSDHIGLFPVVMISPYDSILITEGSEERRKFIDSVISQFDKSYLEGLIKYNKLLLQRNKLLKDIADKKMVEQDLFEVIDAQMIPLANDVYQKRLTFLQNLIPVFNTYYSEISNDIESVSIEYISQLHDHNFEELLVNCFSKDKALGYSTSGIHKDDLMFTLNSFPVKKVGSQGQQKTFLVALKLAEFSFITSKKGFKPILLLDDVFDKFDHSRVEKIIRLVADEKFGQIFITDTDITRLKTVLNGIHEFSLFQVSSNNIQLMESEI